MKQNTFSEASNSAVTQKFPRTLCNQQARYSVLKRSLFVPILIQIDPIHSVPTYFFKIYFNVCLQLRLALPSSVVSSGFITKNLYASPFRPSPRTEKYKM